MAKIIAPHIGFKVLIFKAAGAVGMLLFIQQHLICFWTTTPLSSDRDLNYMRWTFDHNRTNQNQLGFCFNHQEYGPPSLLRHIGLMTIYELTCFWKYLLEFEFEFSTEKSRVKRWIEWSRISMKLTSWSQLSLCLDYINGSHSVAPGVRSTSSSSTTREVARNANYHTLSKPYKIRLSGASV